MSLASPDFGTVTAAEYAELGLRSGLEIHQQLLTAKKLFCRCPAGRISDHYDAEILRHMRPTLSELGEYDGTALMEFKTRKDIIYRLNNEVVCTYEMDDSPPFEINEQAVDIAIEIALLLRLQLIDELHIARKQYLDGSIPTGFQRTTILGVNGWIPYRDRRIRIRQLGLEEDACREVSDVGHVRTFIADRLGMPLVEVVTEAEMHTPQEVAEVGQLLRYLMRATGKVRRGIGSARQDVNVSITGGRRVEVKGVPRLPMIPRLVHYEAYRQRALLAIREELKARGLSGKDWRVASAPLSRVLQGTNFAPIAEALAGGQEVWAVVLPNFAGVLIRPTQPHTIFLQEFSDRVRVVACLQGRPNLIASEGAGQTLTPGEWQRATRAVQAKANDAVIVVWGGPEDVRTAIGEIELRGLDALDGVPNETRQAFADGTNGFERILPGPDRMYPDTDLPPKDLAPERIEQAASHLPERPWERIERYQQQGLSTELAWAVIRSGQQELFDELVGTGRQVPPRMVAFVLACWLKHRRRGGSNLEAINNQFLKDLFTQAGRNDWPKEAVFELIDAALSQSSSNRQIYGVVDPAVTREELSPAVDLEVEESSFEPRACPPSRRPAGQRRRAFLMGQLMRQFRGRVHGQVVAEMVEAALQPPAQAPAGKKNGP